MWFVQGMGVKGIGDSSQRFRDLQKILIFNYIKLMDLSQILRRYLNYIHSLFQQHCNYCLRPLSTSLPHFVHLVIRMYVLKCFFLSFPFCAVGSESKELPALTLSQRKQRNLPTIMLSSSLMLSLRLK